MIQKDQGMTIGITSDGQETPLSAIRPCGMEAPSNEALDISKSLHVTIDYLLRVTFKSLESQVD